MSILYVLIAILLLGILIAVHEAGHFLAARLTGIGVQEFAIGMGPKLFSTVSKKSGTRYSLRLIPMGGFCSFYGEDDATGETADDPRAFGRQAVWKRMLTVLMGPGMNVILALVVITLFFFVSGEVVYQPYVYSVEEGRPAAQCGLLAGDVVETVNGVSVLDGTATTLSGRLQAYGAGDDPLQLHVRRGDESFDTALTPFYDDEMGIYRIGISISLQAETYVDDKGVSHYKTIPMSFLEAAKASADTCAYYATAILSALKALVTTGEGLDQTSGPVGIIATVSTEVEQGGLEAFISLLALLSINLGIMNLLPIPGLDGSRFLFMVLEAIRRKPIPPQKEAVVHLVGMAFLFALMIVFTFRDVWALFQ